MHTLRPPTSTLVNFWTGLEHEIWSSWMILWLMSQGEINVLRFIYQRNSSSESLCTLHCSEYISSRKRDQKHQSQCPLYRLPFSNLHETNSASLHLSATSKPCMDAWILPHGYLLLDLKPTTDDKQQLKSNVLPGENAVLTGYFKEKSCTCNLPCSTLYV